MPCRRVETSGALLVALMSWASVSVAQIVGSPAQSNPLRPSRATPEGVIRTDPALAVTLQWRQRQTNPSQTAAPARYFLLCVYETAMNDCASTPLRWLQGAATISRVPVPSASGPPVITAYDYTFPVLLPPEMIDRQVEWRVGACSSELESSCTSVTTPVWFSTQNLLAHEISGVRSTPGWFRAIGEVRNTGMSHSGPFTTTMSLYLALVDKNGLCVTDVNETSVDAELAYVLTDKGELVRVRDLPRDANGRFDASGYVVRAIVPDAFASGGAGHSGLDPGASANVPDLREDLSFWNLPVTFATRLQVDSTDTVTEYDESDNARGECHIIR